MKAKHSQPTVSGTMLPSLLLIAWAATALAGCADPQESVEPQEATPEYTISGNVAELLDEGEVALTQGTDVLGGTEEIGRT